MNSYLVIYLIFYLGRKTQGRVLVKLRTEYLKLKWL